MVLTNDNLIKSNDTEVQPDRAAINVVPNGSQERPKLEAVPTRFEMQTSPDDNRSNASIEKRRLDDATIAIL